MPADVVLASNRGPLSFSLGDDGALHARRAAAAAWSPACPAATERHLGLRGADRGRPAGGRAAARRAARAPDDRRRRPGADARRSTRHVHPRVQLGRQLDAVVPAPPALRHRARSRRSTSASTRDWQAYVDYNAAFADALAEEAAPGARVLVQDYHLTLAPRHAARRCGRTCGSGTSRTRRGRRRTYFRLLPDDAAPPSC